MIEPEYLTEILRQFAPTHNRKRREENLYQRRKHLLAMHRVTWSPSRLLQLPPESPGFTHRARNAIGNVVPDPSRREAHDPYMFGREDVPENARAGDDDLGEELAVSG